MAYATVWQDNFEQQYRDMNTINPRRPSSQDILNTAIRVHYQRKVQEKSTSNTKNKANDPRNGYFALAKSSIGQDSQREKYDTYNNRD